MVFEALKKDPWHFLSARVKVFARKYLSRSPLRLDQWHRLLDGHPDKDYLLRGIAFGVTLGYQEPRTSRKCCRGKLSPEQTKFLRQKLASERSLGRLVGGFE